MRTDGSVTRDRLKAGLCVVLGCGNASAPGSRYCTADEDAACFENDYTLTEDEQEAREL